MYLAFVAVYMLTTLNIRMYDYFKMIPSLDYYFDDTVDKYTEIDNNVVSDLHRIGYCKVKPCLIKCCGLRQYLGDNGECKDEDYFKELCVDLGFSDSTCSDILREVYNKNLLYMETYQYIWRVNDPIDRARRYSSDESSLLQDGTLFIKLNDTTHFLEVFPRRFCVDFRIDFLSGYKPFKMVYDLIDNHGYKSTEFDTADLLIIYLYGLGGAVLFTFLSLLVMLLRYRKSLRQQYKFFILGVYFLSIIIAYVLKATHVKRLIDGEYEECRYFGPLLYFLLTSAFCWSLAFTYDIFKITRLFRRAGKMVVSANINTFAWVCEFAWGLPLLMTISAIAGTRLDLVLLKPPYDSLFENESQTMFYLHAPISIFIISYGVIFILHTYDIWMVHWAVQNTPLIKNSFNADSRFYAFKILFSLLVFFITFGYIPDMPIVLYYVIRTSIIITGVTLFCLFVFTNTSNAKLIIDWNLFKAKCEALRQRNSKIKPLNDGIAVISNNDLDKKKNLTFRYNLDLVKDEFMSKLLPENLVNFMKNHNETKEEKMSIINNMDIENGGNDIINDEPDNAENNNSNEALESCETKINEDLEIINHSPKS